jgi:hypothetical protein
MEDSKHIYYIDYEGCPIELSEEEYEDYQTKLFNMCGIDG